MPAACGKLVHLYYGTLRPERGLELARSIDRSKLSDVAAVNLAIAMSGARLDQGNAALALAELEIPQLKPDTAFAYSPTLFLAYAEVLDELDRAREAKQWRERADVAQSALDEAFGTAEEAEEFEVVTEYDEPEAPDFSNFVTADELPEDVPDELSNGSDTELVEVEADSDADDETEVLPDEPVGDAEAPKVAE